MTLGPRPNLALTLSAIAGALLMLAQPASAQQEGNKVDNGLERAQKAADAVFHWIKVNGDKGAARQATNAPAPAPAPAQAAARKPAPAPAPVAAAPRPAPTTSQQAPATAAAPAPATFAAAPEPEPEVDRTPVVVASAAPTPAPAAPMAVAAQAVQPPPAPAEEAEEPLKLLVKVDPIIPRQLQQQGFRSGVVQVQFTVGTDGKVSQAQTIKASQARLANAALEAVKQWRFAPLAKPRDAAVEVAFSSES